MTSLSPVIQQLAQHQQMRYTLKTSVFSFLFPFVTLIILGLATLIGCVTWTINKQKLPLSLISSSYDTIVENILLTMESSLNMQIVHTGHHLPKEHNGRISIYTCNHQTYFDTIALMYLMKHNDISINSIGWVFHKFIKYTPIGFCIMQFGSVTVGNGKEKDMKNLSQLVQNIKDFKIDSIFIFPEGGLITDNDWVEKGAQFAETKGYERLTQCMYPRIQGLKHILDELLESFPANMIDIYDITLGYGEARNVNHGTPWDFNVLKLSQHNQPSFLHFDVQKYELSTQPYLIEEMESLSYMDEEMMTKWWWDVYFRKNKKLIEFNEFGGFYGNRIHYESISHKFIQQLIVLCGSFWVTFYALKN